MPSRNLTDITLFLNKIDLCIKKNGLTLNVRLFFCVWGEKVLAISES